MQFPDESIMAMYLVKTHYIMKVLEFHPETQTVDLIQDVYEYSNTVCGQFCIVNEFGQEVVVALKRPDVLYGVPVRQARYGKWSVECCPVPGDTGYIEVFTNDIQDWIENGSQSIPWSDKHFLKKSCVFVPFVPNKTNCDPNHPVSNDAFVIKSDKINITLNSPEEESETITISMTGIQLTINAGGAITLNAPDASVTTTCKAAKVTASELATIDSPQTNITGDVEIGGAVTMKSTLDVTGEATCKDVTATQTGVTLATHTHQFNYSAGSTPSSGTTFVGA